MVRYQLKTPYRDGTTHVLFEPLDFILAIAPGLGLFVGGLVLVITGQASRAVMDNANYSKLMLEEMRKKN